ncbi:hypothetical protein PVAND_015035 [Polypedilum vanderplanki]|uniref:Uncharacterized protein n=1 Tax=Polypedilum vanderplanki TaxID=319348 RepID=A0A9J6BBG0_POLVA|nr:hypothetical protein PVAND_015035 [Polypedilum vanderplanki]
MKIIIFLIILASSLSLILSAPGSNDPVKLTKPKLTTTTPVTTTNTIKETTTVLIEKPSNSIQQSGSDKIIGSSSEESNNLSSESFSSSEKLNNPDAQSISLGSETLIYGISHYSLGSSSETSNYSNEPSSEKLINSNEISDSGSSSESFLSSSEESSRSKYIMESYIEMSYSVEISSISGEKSTEETFSSSEESSCTPKDEGQCNSYGKCSYFDLNQCSCIVPDCIDDGYFSLDEHCNCVCILTEEVCLPGTSLSLKECFCIENSFSSTEESSPTSETSSEEFSSEESSTEPNFTKDLSYISEKYSSLCTSYDCGKCGFFDSH